MSYIITVEEKKPRELNLYDSIKGVLPYTVERRLVIEVDENPIAEISKLTAPTN